VLTISIHEAGRWPGTGSAEDRAGGMARNLPVAPGFNDSEMAYLIDWAVLPLLAAFRPQALLVQTGADALEEDPLARLSLSNNAYWRVVEAVRHAAPRLLVVGGGGYNPYATGRCWAGIWATLNGFAIPARTSEAAERVLRSLAYNRAAGRNPPDHWFTTLRDAPRDGKVSDGIRRLAELTVQEKLFA
jgi:acetoin utilization protein AcuC